MQNTENQDFITFHLCLIQDIISRMAENSFRIKTFAFIFATANLYCAFAFHTTTIHFLAALAATHAFWGLDAYFLQQERKYRALYNKVRRQTTTDYDLNASGFRAPLIQSALSITLATFYQLQILIIALPKLFT